MLLDEASLIPYSFLLLIFRETGRESTAFTRLLKVELLLTDVKINTDVFISKKEK